MSAERKKLIWISLSACVFVLILAATGLYMFAPKKGGAGAPATAGNLAAPKAADPQDYLLSPPAAPTFEQPRAPGDDLVIVYGDKPASLGLPAAGAQPAGTTGLPAAGRGAIPAGPSGAGTAAAAATPPKAAAKAATTKSAATKPAAAKSAPVKVKVDEYWIQAASFASRGRADELKEAIAQKGIAALISVTDVDGKSFYRVRIGPYAAKAEAEGWLGNLKSMAGCESAYVTKKTVEKAQ